MANGGGPGGGDGLTPAKTWILGGVVFLLAGGGNFFSQYFSGAYQSGSQVLGLLGASVLVGLAPALPVILALLPPIRDFFNRRWKLILGAALSVALVLSSIFFLGPLVNPLLNEWLGCAPPTEFTVVTTPAARTTTDDLLAAFEASTAKANYGCPTAHGFVYDAPEEAIQNAVAGGWRTSPDNVVNPRRDVGPRPDIWLTESTLALNSLYDRSQASAVQSSRSFGTSPLVLAVPATPSGAPANVEGSTFPELVASASRSIGVIRPDPGRSTAGLLGTAALYGVDVDRSPQTRPDVPVADDPTIEQLLGAAQAAGAFPDGDEGDALCRFRARTSARPALILSEQSMRRYAAGQLVGGPCASPPGAMLVPVYSLTPTLDHQVIRLGWPDGPTASSAVGEYEKWLGGAEGLRAIEATGLRPTVTGDSASTSLVGRGDIDPGAVESLLVRYRAAYRPRRDLLALDLSGSMQQPSSQGATRSEVVKRAVADASCTVRQNDEIGLWVFPGESDQRPRSVVPVSRGGCNAVISASNSLVPAGNTPLFQTVVDGVGALRATDAAAERRLVILTDGEDTSSQVNRDAVIAALSGAQVKIYIITLGDVTCDADPLQEVADRTGGRCYDPGSSARDLREALGG